MKNFSLKNYAFAFLVTILSVGQAAAMSEAPTVQNIKNITATVLTKSGFLMREQSTQDRTLATIAKQLTSVNASLNDSTLSTELTLALTELSEKIKAMTSDKSSECAQALQMLDSKLAQAKKETKAEETEATEAEVTAIHNNTKEADVYAIINDAAGKDAVESTQSCITDPLDKYKEALNIRVAWNHQTALKRELTTKNIGKCFAEVEENIAQTAPTSEDLLKLHTAVTECTKAILKAIETFETEDTQKATLVDAITQAKSKLTARIQPETQKMAETTAPENNSDVKADVNESNVHAIEQANLAQKRLQAENRRQAEQEQFDEYIKDQAKIDKNRIQKDIKNATLQEKTAKKIAALLKQGNLTLEDLKIRVNEQAKADKKAEANIQAEADMKAKEKAAKIGIWAKTKILFGLGSDALADATPRMLINMATSELKNYLENYLESKSN